MNPLNPNAKSFKQRLIFMLNPNAQPFVPSINFVHAEEHKESDTVLATTFNTPQFDISNSADSVNNSHVEPPSGDISYLNILRSQNCDINYCWGNSTLIVFEINSVF